MNLLSRHQAILVIVSVILFFAYLGTPAVFNEREAESAATSSEMFRRGAWIVPSFNEELATKSPIFFNWMNLFCMRLLGNNELAVRLPSAFMALGTILLTYHLGRKLYSSDIGFLAGIILCSCLFFPAIGRAATPDATLVFCVTVAFGGYVNGVTRQRGTNFCRAKPLSPVIRVSKSEAATSSEAAKENPSKPSTFFKHGILESIRSAASIYIPLGIGALAFGPLAVLIPCAALLLFVFESLRQDDLDEGKIQVPIETGLRNPIIVVTQLFRPASVVLALLEIQLFAGLIIVAAISLPWYFFVTIQTNGQWLQGFLVNHHFRSLFYFTDFGQDFPQHQLYPLIVIFVGCFPWSVFLPVAINRLWERLADGAPWRESDRLLACWIGVWFAIFCLTSSNQPQALLPIYPALSLTMARYFTDWKRQSGSTGVYSFNLCCRALWICGVIMAIFLTMEAYLYCPAEQRFSAIGIIPIIGSLLATRFVEKEKRVHAIRALIATSLLLTFLCIVVIPVTIRPYQESPIFLAEARRFAKSADVSIATYDDYFEPSLVFYSGKRVRMLNSPRQVAEFLTGTPRSYVITKASNYNYLRTELPSGTGELSRHRNFLKGRELVLIGRN